MYSVYGHHRVKSASLTDHTFIPWSKIAHTKRLCKSSVHRKRFRLFWVAASRAWSPPKSGAFARTARRRFRPPTVAPSELIMQEAREPCAHRSLSTRCLSVCVAVRPPLRNRRKFCPQTVHGNRSAVFFGWPPSCCVCTRRSTRDNVVLGLGGLASVDFFRRRNAAGGLKRVHTSSGSRQSLFTQLKLYVGIQTPCFVLRGQAALCAEFEATVMDPWAAALAAPMFGNHVQIAEGTNFTT